MTHLAIVTRHAVGDSGFAAHALPQRAEEDTGAVKPHSHEDEAPEEPGVPVARYPEYDYDIGRDRPDWTTIVECPAEPGYQETIDRVLERNPELVHRITTLVRSAKVSRPARLRRQPEGDRLDLDACIRAAVSHRLGEAPDPRVYASSVRKHRDLSVLVLLDISQSTNDIVLGGIASVLSLEREATALLAHAMSEIGDPFAIHAFCSNGREEVRYLRVKDFHEPYDAAAKSRLAGLKGSLSTRIGAALRHAGAELERRLTHRRLLLVITDGGLSQSAVSALVVANPAGLYRVQMMHELAGFEALKDLGVTMSLPGTTTTWLLWCSWLVCPVLISGALLSRRKVA